MYCIVCVKMALGNPGVTVNSTPGAGEIICRVISPSINPSIFLRFKANLIIAVPWPKSGPARESGLGEIIMNMRMRRCVGRLRHGLVAVLAVAIFIGSVTSPQAQQNQSKQTDSGISSAVEMSQIKTGSAEARLGLKFPAQDFRPPQVSHTTLASGVTLDYFAEQTIPLVTVLVRLRVGSVDDPAGKVGAAEMAGTVIRNGGTAKLSGDELDRQMEARGAQLSVSTSREETWFRLSVLKEDLPWALGVLTDLLTSPALPDSKLEEARAREIVALRERFDAPMDVGRVVFPQLVFGKGSPWGWTSTEATLKALTIADLRAIFEKYYVSGNMKLGICGNVTWADAQRLAGATFGKLAQRPAPQPTLPAVPAIETGRVYIVPREATQNVVYLGHEGANRFDPLKFPVKVFNNVLSGGFTSRLMKEIRSDRGLAYSVYGEIREGTVKGSFLELALTKVESTGQVLDLFRQIDADLMQHDPTPTEVERAKQADINAFVFFFDTPEKIIHQKMTLDGFGYPADYLATYVDKLKAVTPQQVREVASAKLHPSRAIVLVVGQVDGELQAQLAKVGPITEIKDEELRKSWM